MIAESCICCGGRNLDFRPAVFAPFIESMTGVKDHPYSVICLDCDAVFSDKRFDHLELKRLYADYRGEIYTNEREYYEPGYRKRNEELLSGYAHLPLVELFLMSLLKKSPIILDWGGDSGKNTPFKNTAYKIDIYDISEKSVIIGRGVSSPIGCYDLIVCSQVLEHVSSPKEMIMQMKYHMRPDSILYIEVPRQDVEHRHTFHEHINFFSPKSISILLSRCGLKIVKSDTMDDPKISMYACGAA